jgi:dTDP-4-dehydrorhamnose reductase
MPILPPSSEADALPGRIAVVGAAGQLGRALVQKLGNRAIPVTRTALDITAGDAVHAAVARLRPAAVINCAAWTAVDAAEKDSAGCHAVNATAVGHLAAACANHGVRFVQISTDYVFGADRTRTTPYRESDAPGPLNVYGASKLTGEEAARVCQDHLVIRTCGLYAASPEGPIRGRNFLDTMLVLAATLPEVRVVADQICTPSYVPHVADGILRLLTTEAVGTFHVVNEGQTSWYELASELFRRAGITTRVVPIESSAYPSLAERPRYSVLDTSRFAAATGTRLPPWTEGVTDYLRACGRLAVSPAIAIPVDSGQEPERISCSPSS